VAVADRSCGAKNAGVRREGRAYDAGVDVLRKKAYSDAKANEGVLKRWEDLALGGGHRY